MSQNIRLILITNDPSLGLIAESAGVDWIFVDLEYRGKLNRQFGRNTLISSHTIEDIEIMRQVVKKSKLIVRINPIGEWSEKEIIQVVEAGADIVMLPYFSTVSEVSKFISLVNKKIQTCLLFETLQAIEDIDQILKIPGIDYVHIGLNDIHIARGTSFMFEFLSDGSLDYVAKKFRQAGITFGFGGIGRIGDLLPPAERILAEHIRVGSTGVILSRSFCNLMHPPEHKEFEMMFKNEVIKRYNPWDINA
jgi:2-keto-3-deoxy-L-rhamnonate aldolase RhmA